jgi:hypothetical protein
VGCGTQLRSFAKWIADGGLDPQSLQVSLPLQAAALGDASREAKSHSREPAAAVVTFDSFKRGAELRAVFKAALAADARWQRRRQQHPQEAAAEAMQALECWVKVQPLEQARALARSSYVHGR